MTRIRWFTFLHSGPGWLPKTQPNPSQCKTWASLYDLELGQLVDTKQPWDPIEDPIEDPTECPIEGPNHQTKPVWLHFHPSLRIPWSHKVKACPFLRRTEMKYFWSWPWLTHSGLFGESTYETLRNMLTREQSQSNRLPSMNNVAVRYSYSAGSFLTLCWIFWKFDVQNLNKIIRKI